MKLRLFIRRYKSSATGRLLYAPQIVSPQKYIPDPGKFRNARPWMDRTPRMKGRARLDPLFSLQNGALPPTD